MLCIWWRYAIMEEHLYWRYAHNVMQYGDKIKKSIRSKKKVRIYCLSMMFANVGNWHLVQVFHKKKCMFIASTSETSKEHAIVEFDSHRACSWTWGSLTNLLVLACHLHHSLPLLHHWSQNWLASIIETTTSVGEFENDKYYYMSLSGGQNKWVLQSTLQIMN